MGILGHSSHSRMPETLEGQIVRKSDQIAYITTTSTTPCAPGS